MLLKQTNALHVEMSRRIYKFKRERTDIMGKVDLTMVVGLLITVIGKSMDGSKMSIKVIQLYKNIHYKRLIYKQKRVP